MHNGSESLATQPKFMIIIALMLHPKGGSIRGRKCVIISEGGEAKAISKGVFPLLLTATETVRKQWWSLIAFKRIRWLDSHIHHSTFPSFSTPFGESCCARLSSALPQPTSLTVTADLFLCLYSSTHFLLSPPPPTPRLDSHWEAARGSRCFQISKVRSHFLATTLGAFRKAERGIKGVLQKGTASFLLHPLEKKRHFLLCVQWKSFQPLPWRSYGQEWVSYGKHFFCSALLWDRVWNVLPMDP